MTALPLDYSHNTAAHLLIANVCIMIIKPTSSSKVRLHLTLCCHGWLIMAFRSSSASSWQTPSLMAQLAAAGTNYDLPSLLMKCLMRSYITRLKVGSVAFNQYCCIQGNKKQFTISYKRCFMTILSHLNSILKEGRHIITCTSSTYWIWCSQLCVCILRLMIH